MGSVSAFARNNLVLVIAILASTLLLVIGLLLIQTTEVPAPTSAADVPINEELLKDIPALPEIDRSPPADLPTMKAALAEMSKNVAPQPTLTHDELNAALAAAEPGSEPWCDLMLQKADGDWTIDESKLFAQHCI